MKSHRDRKFPHRRALLIGLLSFVLYTLYAGASGGF